MRTSETGKFLLALCSATALVGLARNAAASGWDTTFHDSFQNNCTSNLLTWHNESYAVCTDGGSPGKVYVANTYTDDSGATYARIWYWDNGNPGWASFHNALLNGPVYALAVAANGILWVGGHFDSASDDWGSSAGLGNILRISIGGTGALRPCGSGVSNAAGSPGASVRCLQPSPSWSGYVWVGGDFDDVSPDTFGNTISANSIALCGGTTWWPTPDPSSGPGVVPAPSYRSMWHPVRTIQLKQQSYGGTYYDEVIVAGNFTKSASWQSVGSYVTTTNIANFSWVQQRWFALGANTGYGIASIQSGGATSINSAGLMSDAASIGTIYLVGFDLNYVDGSNYSSYYNCSPILAGFVAYPTAPPANRLTLGQTWSGNPNTTSGIQILSGTIYYVDSTNGTSPNPQGSPAFTSVDGMARDTAYVYYVGDWASTGTGPGVQRYQP